jgi:predicted permease
MSQLAFDLRDVLKSLRRTPGYTLTVLATLALTIGASTAVFSIVDGVLLKPLAYPEPERLVSLREVWREVSDRLATLALNERHFEHWRANSTTFEALAQYLVLPANLTGAGDAAQIAVGRASGTLFDVLKTRAAIGRVLTLEDERADRPAVAVLTDACWRQRFGADPAMIGRAVFLDGESHVVVGILPAGFHLPSASRARDALDAIVPIRTSDERPGWVGDHNMVGIGRLKPGVTTGAAQAELDVLQRQASALAAAEAHEAVTLTSVVEPLADAVTGGVRRGLLLLLGAIAGVVLIACSNLANLALTRSISLQRDAAIRSALGASGGRLAVRALFEQLLLAMAGGALGVWLAWAALALFARTAPADLPRVTEVALNTTVLLFAAGVSIAVGLAVGIAPVSRLGSRTLVPSLRGTGTAHTSDRSSLRARETFLAVQIGLSAMLLVVTSLITVSFIRLMSVDRGFAADRVAAVAVALPSTRYADFAARTAAYDRLVAAVQRLPGVTSATVSSMRPLGGEGQVNFIVADGDTRPRATQPSANFRYVAPDYFRTLGLPLLRGRSFEDGERDRTRPTPAVVSQRTAARLWPGADPIGRVFSRGLAGEPGYVVVGVAAEARTTSLDAQPPLMVYAPYWRMSRTATTLMIKSTGDPSALAAAVHQALGQIDPEIAVGDAQTLDAIVDASVAGRRYQVRLFVAFTAIALAIAIIGVYGTTAYGVSRRRREMNIRVALGAARADVIALIVRQGGWPIAAGLAIGGAGALGLGNVVASLLFDVQPRDPWILGGAIVAVGGVGLLACLLATMQGLVIDPAAALREE